MTLADLGPQLQNEPARVRRLRLHQSWYRAAVLGLDNWGTTARGTPLGSILDRNAAQAGVNLESEEARLLFRLRAERGWGIDRSRVLAHMTSSQALMINLLGPMLCSPRWLLDWLRLLLPRESIVEVLRAEIEYAPSRRSDFMNDMTMVDFFVEYRTPLGIDSAVVEFKYADRINSRFVAIGENERYKALLAAQNLWLDPAVLVERRFNQLARCHALGTSVLRASRPDGRESHLIVIAEEHDVVARETTLAYADVLFDSTRCSHHTLTAAIGFALVSARGKRSRRLLEALRLRYVDLSASEYLTLE